LLERGTDSLVAVCRRYGADYLLVPPSPWLEPILRTAPEPLHSAIATTAERVNHGLSINREQADRVVIHMMVLGESPAPFEKMFERDGWRLYRLPRPGS
jgi:hypothetical protein